MAAHRSLSALLLVIITIVVQLVVETGGVTRVDIDHHARRRTVRAAGPGGSPGSFLDLGPGEGLKASASSERTSRGTEMVRLTETFRGLTVRGESVVVELDNEGLPTGKVRGSLVTGIEEDLPSISPTLEKDDVLEISLMYTKDSTSDVKFNPDRDAHLQVYVLGAGRNIKAKLTYKLSYRIETAERISRPSFIMDANTGIIYKQWDAISMASLEIFPKRGLYMHSSKRSRSTEKSVSGVGGNTKVGKYTYGSGGLPALKVTLLDDGKCALANELAEAYHCASSYDCEVADMQCDQFDCVTGNRDTANGAYSPLNDAFFNVGQTYNMFHQWFNVTDIFLQGTPVKARVHYGEQFENAFWDGETIALGDGGDALFPLTSLNMVAHEMAHGFTEMRAGLDTIGQSGAINEAFSDMAGEAAEFFSRNSTDWLISYADTKTPNASLRYFAQPSRDGSSIGHYRNYCLGIEPHSASGIFNRAFFLLANSAGWGVRKAFHVFLTANSLYWHPDSQFHDAACDVVNSAGDLGYDEDDVTKAFMDVGIEPCSEDEARSLPGPVLVEASHTMTFQITTHGIDVAELVFVVDSYDIVDMTIDTGGLEFEVKSPHGYLPHTFTLPTVGGCLQNKPCTVTMSAQEDSRLSVYPMAHLQTLVTADSLGADQSVLTTFNMPTQVIQGAVRIAFRATTGPGGGLMYYIRHGSEPDVTSRGFDVMGTTDRDAVLCNPRNGTYYIRAVPLLYTESPVSDVTVGLYASFNAELISDTETEE